MNPNRINVRTFGAVGDGSHDDTVAIQAAINSFSSGTGTIYFPTGNYKVTSTITVAQDRIHLVGDGMWATKITFVPSAGGAVFSCTKGASVIYQGSIRGFAFDTADTSYQKIAVSINDASGYTVEDIATLNWNGALSEGIRIAGREFGLFRNLYLSANIPVHIIGNPNSTIDIDHHHFQDLYLTVIGNNPCVSVNDGVNLTHVIFDGVNPWVLGTHGFYWPNASAVQNSYGLILKNIRTEQGTDATKASIYIINNSALQDLLIENCELDTTRPGVLLSGVTRVTNRHLNYGGTSLVAYDSTAGQDSHLLFENCVFGAGSTATLTNYQQIWSMGNRVANSPIPPNAEYKYAFSDSNRYITNFSVPTTNFTGTLNAAASINLYCGVSENRILAKIELAAIDQIANTQYGASIVVTEDAALLIVGSPNVAITNVAAKLCIFKDGNSVTLLNNLANAVKYIVTVATVS